MTAGAEQKSLCVCVGGERECVCEGIERMCVYVVMVRGMTIVYVDRVRGMTAVVLW